ncbi:ESX-1 secretion-associated protein EspJ [Mycolicibacterium vanbaalenii]|uniref:ESX-1 secretion-associated protein EspJ n=1 Tax=Mycolicibacterium vanbaalenii TaxID=110539 RepID=A0A5S9QWM3_MYCVN|nr:type VII secretion target [Mycolicibacterium vanbaalenii]CAA0124406.1 ESX-1 secretion-associated protein EspJ [Mycolicibacterium vanbaalenii]
MSNPPPLSVDPEQLGTAGGELLTSAGQLPAAPAPFMPVGKDPLSAAIISQIPHIEEPVMTQLPAVQAQSTKTANNVVAAAQAYSSTDQQLGGQISQEMQTLPNTTPGGGSGGPASPAGADSMGQMTGMVGQVAQMPMQVMGAAAALPQGVMQGAQQVGQQVQQVAGQFGQGGTGGQTGYGGQGDSAATANNSGGGFPEGERAEEPKPDGGHAREDDPGDTGRDGAAASDPGAERAPDTTDMNRDGAAASPGPGRHRATEPDDRIDL